MSSSNLPPGVSESSIPGNRPEDAKYAARAEAVCDVLGDDVDEDKMDRLIDMLDAAERDGYGDGLADARLEAESELASDLSALRAVADAARGLCDPVETAGNRCSAQDGPVGDDLLMVATDKDLRRRFDRAYRKLRAALARLEQRQEGLRG